MSGKGFTRVAKPASATPTRQSNAPVQQRSPARAPLPPQVAPQHYHPNPHGGAAFDLATIPLFPPAPVQAKPGLNELEEAPQERRDNATASVTFAPPADDRLTPPDTNPFPARRGFNLPGSAVLQRQEETEQEEQEETTEEERIQTKPLAELPPLDPRDAARFFLATTPLSSRDRADDIPATSRGYSGSSSGYFMEPVRPRPMGNMVRAPQVQRQAKEEEDETVQAKSLLQRQAGEEEEETVQAKSLLQRQAGEEEEETVQAKLTVGEPNDKYEQEADRMADTVMHPKGTSFGARMPEPVLQRQEEAEEKEEVAEEQLQTKPLAESITPLVQRQAEEGEEEEEELVQAKSLLQRQAEEEEEEPVQAKARRNSTPTVSTDLEGQLNRTQGSGQPLSESSRQFFEPRFGQDFGDVRIHADGQSAEAAKTIQAQAFTHKQDIYFGAGHYQPDTDKGKTLLAHELTHTVQQTGKQPAVNRDVISRRAATASEGITNPAETQVKTPESTALQQNETAPDQELDATTSASIQDQQKETETPQTEAPEVAEERPLDEEQPEPAEKIDAATTPPPPSPAEVAGPAAVGGEAAAEEAPPLLETDNPAELLGAITNAPATEALSTFNKAQAASQTVLDKEKTATETSLPKIKTPTGLSALASDQAPAKPEKAEAKTPATPTTFEGEKSGTPADPNKAILAPTKIEATQTFRGADRALLAAKVSDGADPSDAKAALNNINLETGSVPQNLGSRPAVNTSGEADPAQADAFQVESQQKVSAAKGEARAQSNQDFGEKAVFPAPDDSVIEAKQKMESTTVSAEQQAMPQPIPAEVKGDIDQSMGANLKPALEQEQAQYADARQQHDTGKAEAEADTKAKTEALDEETKAKQQEEQAKVQQQVADHRKEWQGELDQVDQEFEAKSSKATTEQKARINSEKQKGQQEADGHFKQAETEAARKKQEAKAKADQEKAKGEKESQGFFGWLGSKVANFIDGIKKAVNTIFEGLKKAVKFLFDKAKQLALAAIELARKAVVGLIKGLGTLLKGLVSVVFAAFPAIAKKINAKIDAAVNAATQAVNAAAAALKQGVAKLLDVLASVINGLLSVVQAAYNFALGAMSLIVKGEFGKLGQYIVQSALKLIGASLGGLMQLLGISEEDVQKIIADPVGFLKNLVGAIRTGLNKFVANIVKHLTSGLLGWLFGAFANVGIQLPTKFNLAGIFTFIAQILGVTYDALRARLVKRLGSTGETIVSAFEKSFAFMKEFITRGPIVLWERVKGALSNLKELLFTPVIEWLRNTIIVKAITKLVAFFNPVGAIVQAIQAIYNVAMFFKERWEQIKSFAQTVFSSIKNIAAGQIGSAAGFIEQSLAKAIPIMISFLARLIGLGGIVDKVKKVIGKIKRPIDKAVDRVLGWLARMARKAWTKLKGVLGKREPKRKKPKTQAERNQQVKEGLAELHREENKVDEDKDKKLTFEQAQTVAKRIKKRFPVFSKLTVVDAGTRWDYEYAASPGTKEKGQDKETDVGRPEELIGKKTPRLDELEKTEPGVAQRYVKDFKDKRDSLLVKDILRYVEGRAARKLGRVREGPGIALYNQITGAGVSTVKTTFEILDSSGEVREPRRIPDFFKLSVVVGDVKNVNEQSHDPQMKDNVRIAKANNVRIAGETENLEETSRFDLVVDAPSDKRPAGTVVYKPLKDAINGTGGKVYEVALSESE